MIFWKRIETGLLALAGTLVASLMGYTLFFTGWRTSTGPAGPIVRLPPPAARVAIFLPDRHDWADFRLALVACERKGLFVVELDQEDQIVVTSVRSGRRVQFERHDVRGVSDTRAEVRRLKQGDRAPIAVVGSTTTVLTVALAEPLHAEGMAGPILAVPWATAELVQRSPNPGATARQNLVPLMDLDPGRTFRFCPNNHRLADSVVSCLVARDDGRLPGRVFLIIDPFDPYSEDLAGCFRQAIRARKPDVEIVERADVVDVPGFALALDAPAEPSPTESDLADAVVASQATTDIRPTWVVLPLQDQPARRMITALRRRSAWQAGQAVSSPARGPLRVVCGDAIERAALIELAGQGGLSIWCASTSSTFPAEPAISDDTQTLAEIAAALVWAVDRAASPGPTPEQIRQVLATIDLAADSPFAFGRRLAFEPNGERRGAVERVIAVRPDSPRPIAFARVGGNSWEPIGSPAPASAR